MKKLPNIIFKNELKQNPVSQLAAMIFMLGSCAVTTLPAIAKTCATDPVTQRYSCEQTTAGENLTENLSGLSDLSVTVNAATTGSGNEGNASLTLSNSHIYEIVQHGIYVRGKEATAILNGNNSIGLDGSADTAVLVNTNGLADQKDATIIVNGTLRIYINKPGHTNNDGLEAGGLNAFIEHHGQGTITTDGGNAIWANAVNDISIIADGGSVLNVFGDGNSGIKALAQNGNASIESNSEITVQGGSTLTGIVANVTKADSTGNATVTVKNTDSIFVSGDKDIVAIKATTAGFGDAIINVESTVEKIESLAQNAGTNGNIGNEGIFAHATGTGNAVVNSHAAKVVVSGHHSDGLYAHANDGNATVTATGTVITKKITDADERMHGIVALARNLDHTATVQYTGSDDSSVSTEANSSHAIYATAEAGAAAKSIVADATLSTIGKASHGITTEALGSGNGATSTTLAQGTKITVAGDESVGIYSSTIDGKNIVNVIGSTIKGGKGALGKGAGIVLTSTNAEQVLIIDSDSEISAINDSAIYTKGDGTITSIKNEGEITGYITHVGKNADFEHNGTLSLRNFGADGTVKANIVNDLGTDSVFKNNGMIKFDDANFTDGTNTNAIFTVTNFENNLNGVIDLTGKNPEGLNELAGDTFTINGNYVSNGGSVFINTVLDDGANGGTSDRLIINGDVIKDDTSAGAPTSIFVTPTSNGLGALTTGNGIEVVTVSGESNIGDFKLGKAVTAGSYEYVLGKGAADNNWYLTSFDKNSLLYSPSIGAYLANQTAATEMFQQTLFDRLISSSGFDNDATKKLFWLRTKHSQSQYNSVHNSMQNKGHTTIGQLGGDLGVWNLNDGYLHVGVMAGYGDFENTSKSRFTGTKAKGKVKGYMTGVYGTWFQNQDTNLGLYVDTWSQYSWYRNEVSGDAQVGTKKYNSTVWSNSVELGYGYSLGKARGHEFIVTPQAQLTYDIYDVDNMKDKNELAVTDNNANGLTSRLGLRLHSRSLTRDQVEPFAEFNYLNSTAKNQFKFNGDKQHAGIPRDRLEAKVGLKGNLNKSWSLSTEVGTQWGQNSFKQYQGQVNINYQW